MILKKLVFIFLILAIHPIYSQKINQLDDDGKRHGIWERAYNGTKQLRYSGLFDHGTEVGEFKFYDRAGGHPTAVKKYTSGRDLLDVLFYTTQGKLVSQGTMKGRLREGKWYYYHKDGKTLLSIENYTNDFKTGQRLEYFASGTKALEENYEMGKREGTAYHYAEDGYILKELTYKNNVLQGVAKLYDGLGNLIKEGNYKNNKKHGIWRYYVQGKLVKEIKFPQNIIGVEH